MDKQAGRYIRIVRVSLRKDKALSANKKKLAEVVRRFDSENAANGRIALDVDPEKKKKRKVINNFTLV